LRFHKPRPYSRLIFGSDQLRTQDRPLSLL
jgi:hypothetical protein